MGHEQYGVPPKGGEDSPIRIERLTESYRFDQELATLLTHFQYRADGIALTAAQPRALPSAVINPPTPGLATVFNNDASLVFVCYNARGHRMVNPIEIDLIEALTTTLEILTTRSDGGTAKPLAEGSSDDSARTPTSDHENRPGTTAGPSVGVVTPHNAQRGALNTTLPESITTNTVEKYQGGERDIIAVSATVSDPEFARKEEQFILNPRRLLVAISRARLLTIVVCSTALFEVAPDDGDRLDNGPVWARLFTQATGGDPEPAWTGLLGEFTPTANSENSDVPVAVYPSTIDRAADKDRS